MEANKAQIERLRRELKLQRQQGCDTWELERKLNLARKSDGHRRKDYMRSVREGIRTLEPEGTFSYEEPSSLSEIRENRPEGPRSIGAGVSEGVRRDKTLGAWTGRVAGCMLGMPVEGWNWQRIQDVLKSRGAYPLNDYFPAPTAKKTRDDTKNAQERNIYREHVEYGVKDDDTNYTVLGLRVLERCGRDFTSRDVAEQWLMDLPYSATYTAERAAYRNFVNDVWPPESARERNPYREWIGAQIRADIWGYVNPGHPERAAGMAFRDARISHTRNGLYGEMYVAAIIASGFVTRDCNQIIRIGLSEIPSESRLAEIVNSVIQWHDEDDNPQQTFKRIVKRYDDYGNVHVLGNAAIVTAALLWGDGDFTRSVGLAVMGGMDTDCNGATVGSILGVLNGIDGIPDRWKNPLNDTLKTDIAEDAHLSLAELSDRTATFQNE